MTAEYGKGPEFVMTDLGLSLQVLQGQSLEILAKEKGTANPGFNQGLPQRAPREGGDMCCRRDHVAAPRVSHTVEAFQSRLLRAWERHKQSYTRSSASPSYRELSTRDFKLLLKLLWYQSRLLRSSNIAS